MKTLLASYYAIRQKVINVYSFCFFIIIWQPFIWDLIKPKDGVIDNKKPWFLRHSVNCLNRVRGSKEGWVIAEWKGCGKLFRLRDPYSHPQKDLFKYSDKHLFVVEREEA